MDDVYVFKKTLLERYDDCLNIFSLKSEIKPSEIQKEWSNFLDVVVEPAGWQAIWKVPRATCDVLKLRFPINIIGTVNQVYYDDLTANFTIEEVEDCGADEEVNLPDQYDVSLMELFPTKSQENQALNIERTAEGIDSLRFFYSHIWRAWDADCDVDMDWNSYLETRIKFYFDLISQKMSKRLAVHIKNLLEEANYVFKRKQLIEEEMDDEDDDVPTKNVKELMHLHYRLKLLRNDLEMLENEDMRQVFESIKFSANGDGCDSTKRFSLNVHEQPASKGSTFIVCPESNFKELSSFINSLQIKDDTPVSTHHSLADVFEHCSNVKQIYLSPATHTLNFNENLFGKCTITGSNSTLTSKVFETTLLTLNGSFVLENITFDCKNSSVGLVITEGKTILRNCTLIGKPAASIQEGIIVTGNASLTLENCKFVNFATALQTRRNSTLSLNDVTIKDCQIGLDLGKKANSNMSGVKFENVKKECLKDDAKIEEEKDENMDIPEKDVSFNDSSIICIDD